MSELNTFQLAVLNGEVGPSMMEALPGEDSPIRPLAEARGLSRGCLDANAHFQRFIDTIQLRGVDENDRWWLQFYLLSARITASRLLKGLANGVRDLILLAYPQNSPISMGGFTRSNAHDLIGALTLETVRRAWGKIYDLEEYGKGEMHPIKQGSGGLGFPNLLTFDQPLVAMTEEGTKNFPLFRDKHLKKVIRVIEKRPKFNVDELNARLQWEFVHARQILEQSWKSDSEATHQQPRTDDEQKLRQFTSRRFAVGLSFPGEHREFVRGVADSLAEVLSKETVLYDHYHKEEFARKDLDVYLPNLYYRNCDLNIVFLCKEYDKKMWCGLEWRAIRNLVNKSDPATLMFIRFDDAEVEGVYPGDGYLDATSPEDVFQMIVKRRFRLYAKMAMA